MHDHPENRDQALVAAIVRELNLALSFIKGISMKQFEQDVMRQHAVAMAVAQTGEYVKKLSQDFRKSVPQVEWRAIAGTRDWIVHDYDGLDFEEIYRSVTQQAPEVLHFLEPLVEELDRQRPRHSPRRIEDFLDGSDEI